MITQSQFIREFSKIETSFNRALRAEVKDGWYDEIRNVEYIPYARTVNVLKMGDFFPKFKDFWIVYRIEAKRNGRNNHVEYCGNCVNGMIYIWEIHTGTGDEVSAVAFCQKCHPDRNPRINPFDKSVRFQFDHAKEFERQQKADMDFRDHIKSLWKNKMQSKFNASDPSNEAQRKRLATQEGYGVESFQSPKERHESLDSERQESAERYKQQEIGL